MDEQKGPFNPLLACLAALAALFFVFPLIGMITGAPWGNVFGIITSQSSLDALGLSIIASLASTVIALLFGFPLAWLLARGSFPGKGVVRGLTTLPMVLPPVVGGIALLLARPPRVHRRAGGQGVRDLAAVHAGRGHRGRVVRGHAVLRDHGGVRAALDEPAAGGRRAQPGRSAPDRLPPGDAAAHLALARGRHGADLGPGAGRVRGDDHLRREPARAHPDHAAGHLRQPELGQDGRGDRAEPGAGRGQPGGHGLPAPAGRRD